MQLQVAERVKTEDMLYSMYVHACAHFDNVREEISACVFWIAFRLKVLLCRVLQSVAGPVFFISVVCVRIYVWACTHVHVCVHTHTHTHTPDLIQLDIAVSIAASLSYSTNTFQHLLCARHGFKHWRSNGGHKIPPSKEFIIYCNSSQSWMHTEFSGKHIKNPDTRLYSQTNYLGMRPSHQVFFKVSWMILIYDQDWELLF